MEQTTLYYQEGSSDKVYQASVQPRDDGYVVQFAFGRRGTALQTGTKTPIPVAYAEAKSIYEKLVAAKTAKGYSPGENGVPYQHTADAERFTGILPQLLNSIDDAEAERLIRDPLWWLQEKYDGRRRLIRKTGEEISGINRRGLLVDLPQPWVADCRRCPADFLLDGEAMGDHLMVFDLLAMNRTDIRNQSYLERHLMLMHLLSLWGSRRIRLVKTVCSDKEKRWLFDLLRACHAEEAVFKRIDQPYAAGGPASGGPALKLKFVESATFIVSRVNAKRSVSLALMADGVAKNAGNVTIPPNEPIPVIGQVVEVRYLYAFPESGHIYQPVYLGLREDIAHEECTLSQLKYKAAGNAVPEEVLRLAPARPTPRETARLPLGARAVRVSKFNFL